MRALAIAFVLLVAACGEPVEDIPCTDFRVMLVYETSGAGPNKWIGPHAKRLCVVAEMPFKPGVSK